ncbi:cytochrome c biogenesis CcdA family protein [Alkaliphilus transvaalensis]|uniref:cytochrome c biogenesis CcdA family protein n=1 Tax=Alkaliphilus transvaalensis TaxID=114628 RepID=UPI00047BA303|nr:cytochrome c biogenesis CcdA family protein [Alkaliphilus transvaalensis]
MVDLSVLLIFLAGMVSFLSPCVLSLVPAYVGFITNNFDEGNDIKGSFVLKRGILFVLGFSFIFVLMGASVGAIGSFFIRYRILLIRVGGLFIIAFGLKMLGLLKLSFLNKELRFKSPKVIKHGGDALLMGMAFATGWTPCVGPVLASVLLYVSTTSSIYLGILLLLVYSIGMAVPFLITALTISGFQRILNRYDRVLPIISKIGGVVMIFVGILIFTNRLSVLNRYFDFYNFKI